MLGKSKGVLQETDRMLDRLDPWCSHKLASLLVVLEGLWLKTGSGSQQSVPERSPLAANTYRFPAAIQDETNSCPFQPPCSVCAATTAHVSGREDQGGDGLEVFQHVYLLSTRQLMPLPGDHIQR